jgi:flagellin
MISVNTNSAASAAAYNLNNINASLQKSLNRLSSGSRINSSVDDAGGLAVSMRLSAAIRRTEATQSNVSNGQAFLETQDGVLKTADKVIARMSELTQLATDVTKSTSDLALYQTEVNTLKAQLNRMMRESFNGISLFSIGTSGSTPLTSTTLNIVTSQDGTQSVGVTQADLGSMGVLLGTTGNVSTVATTEGINITTVSNAQSAISTVNQAIQNLAQLRAYNGSEQSRLNFAADVLVMNKTNLESANSRIVDVDIASESSNLARLNILQQAGTAMLAQANQSSQSLLRLLA